MGEVLQKLKGGDLRSIGRAEEVIEDILKNPSLFAEVFEGMLHDDPRVRMRIINWSFQREKAISERWSDINTERWEHI